MAIKIEIGEMRSTATLQRNNPVNNDSGGQVDVWTNVCTFRCRIQQRRSFRTVEQMQPTNTKDFELVTRASLSLTMTLSYDCRIIFNGQPYAVKSYDLEQVNKRHWYQLIISKNG